MILRPYQEEALDALYDYFAHKDGNPLIVLPTASGKSFVMATFIQEVITNWAAQRILVLTHVKELIEQNYRELCSIWPDAPAGIYSAGMRRADRHSQILFGGIQTIHNKANLVSGFSLIIIDEAHLVPQTMDTQYRRFLDDMIKMNANVKIIGLTATHYRLDSGLLTEGTHRIFTDVAYEVSIRRLIDEGYLAPLITKDPLVKLDVSSVRLRGGEYIPSELVAAVDKATINNAVVEEICRYGVDRKSWLVFCTGIAHAEHVRDCLRDMGIKAETVSGETVAMERNRILNDFKSGKIRAVTNCDILTTGFNAPAVDLMAILRPTQSTGLYVQIAGRGMRLAPGKENCIVLDFAGNIDRHGPIDKVTPRSKQTRGGEAPVKTCPKCKSVVFGGCHQCPDCGYEFPSNEEPEINTIASHKDIISNPEPFWVNVKEITYSKHEKAGKPASIKVTYRVSFVEFYCEWICIEHDGFAREKAISWWAYRSEGGRPGRTVDEFIWDCENLKQPSRIQVVADGKYFRVRRYDFTGPEPEIIIDMPISFEVQQETFVIDGERIPFPDPGEVFENDLPF